MVHENLPPQNERYDQTHNRPEEALGGGFTEPVSVPVEAEVAEASRGSAALEITNLVKVFGQQAAVDGVNLTVPRGSFYGLVGRNGAGKTTTLSMATGLLKPTAGQVLVGGLDIWANPLDAKRRVGVLPDGVRLFDKLTGEQLLTYAGRLHGLDKATVAERTRDLLTVMDLTGAAGRKVADYSAGMTKKIALACAMIHAPSLLVLDEPFEAVDPVSASNIQDILKAYVAGGGTVIISSHVMDLVQRLCDHVAIINAGRILASGTVEQVRGGVSLEERFVELVGGRVVSEGISWLQSS
ncbi:ABC transporter ATP-binding protein [Rothia nasimurium]|uniref:ABC transporter ATP-binding protein n=1 Tax=Rothia nasimurium TaxID=85336 RepID=A0A4Y9F2V8_9MICC|nr:ABC transporter ATP-binding protein [Rothia nasimurium]MBF0808879.1 ABC transporter ATP-binding protein [Rothia nasimurium]TFU21167.1 ABC transporter ATP-binding protein [Rothia nasimurium]